MIELRDFAKWMMGEMLQHLLAAYHWVTAIPRHMLIAHVEVYEETAAGGTVMLALGTFLVTGLSAIGVGIISMFQGVAGILIFERVWLTLQLSLVLAVCYALVVLFVVKFRKFRRQRQAVIDNLKKDYT